MLKRGAVIISSVIGVGALFAGAFYFLLGQINRVDDTARAMKIESSSEVENMKVQMAGLTATVEALGTAVDNLGKNQKEFNIQQDAKLNIILQKLMK